MSREKYIAQLERLFSQLDTIGLHRCDIVNILKCYKYATDPEYRDFTPLIEPYAKNFRSILSETKIYQHNSRAKALLLDVAGVLEKIAESFKQNQELEAREKIGGERK